MKLPPWAVALAGPALIVGCVLISLRDFIGGALLATQHPDLAAMWIPTFGYLGNALSHLHVPDWNPYAFAGMPFAADPQSGWTYVPAMALFSLFSPSTALNCLILLNPILTGLGAYAFLRSEGYGRPAATVAGLCASLPLATSRLGLSLPLVGALAWTSVMLAAASKAMRERRPGRVVAWGLATAFCWGQVANAHLSNGLVIASALLALYLAVVILDERSTTPGWSAWRRGGGLVLALPLVNAAVLLPRLSYLGRSNISVGYSELDALSRAISGLPTVPIVGLSTTEAGVSLASLPGPYLGLLGFALALAWWQGGLRRPLALALAGAAAIFTLFGSNAFAEGVQPLVGGGTIGGFLTHEPFRFLFGEVLVLGLLAGIGAESVIRMAGNGAATVAFAPGAALWALSALGQGSRFDPSPLGILAAAAAVAAVVLAPRRLPLVLVGLLAYDLLLPGALGDTARYAGDRFPLHRASLSAEAFLEPSEPERAVADAAPSGERYAPWAAWNNDGLGPFGQARPETWGIGGTGRSMLFGGMDVGGYNPSQPIRTWIAMRMLDPGLKRYNQSFVTDPSPTLVDLLHLRWVIAGEPPAWADPTPTVTDGAFSLYRVPGGTSLATFPGRVTRGADRDAAFAAVASSTFDPGEEAVWEGEASLAVAAGSGTASATWTRDDRLSLDVDATRGGLLVIRVPWDPAWRASIDGEPVPTVVSDGFVTGVVVPAGSYVLSLNYDDPAIGWGLVLSSVVCAIALGIGIRWRRKAPFEVISRLASGSPGERSRPIRRR